MDVLDTSETATHIRVSKPTLERWRVSGNGPPFVKLGKAVRYRRSDLDEWLASRVVRSTSEGV